MSAVGARARSRGRLPGFAMPRSGRLAVVGSALVGSRLLVLAAGALGALVLHKHDRAAATVALQALGPVGNALAGSVDRFDAAYYLSIAAHGYGTLSSGKVAFFPLYPLLIAFATPALGSAVLAGASISLLAFVGALVSLHRLTELELGRPAADATIGLLAFAPLSFFFSAVYTESLFLLLSVGSMLALRLGRWRLACLLGALAAVTRSVGVLLFVVLVAARIRDGHRDRTLAWALAIPGALLAWLAGVAVAGYPLLAPFAVGGQWDRVTAGPLTGAAAGAWDAIRALAAIARGGAIYSPALTGPFTAGAEAIVLFTVLVISVAALVACARRLPGRYTAYAALTLAMVLSSPVATQPLESFDRYALTIFPLWMVAGGWLSRRSPRTRGALLGLSALCLGFYTAQFASWAFVA